ncbi:MAG: YsnF/AvaK domain-containing protein [Gemmatimonadaceae bacterium]|nr:YsnF/AvaK domain-containing protein [Gloeobacterales cyanobacterium ES-bin-141]
MNTANHDAASSTEGLHSEPVSGRTMIAGLFAYQAQAESAIAQLRNTGFTDDQLDVVPSENRERAGLLVTVMTADRVAEALEILTRNGGDTGTGYAHLGSSQEPSPAATGERQRIELRAETLHVNKRQVKTGEVRIRKEIITEIRTIQVPVTREELVIEQHVFKEGEADTDAASNIQEIRIPLMEEQVVIEKRSVVIEEVFIDKQRIQEVRRITEPIRREQLLIEHEKFTDPTPDRLS